jgi:hypothetical protein
MTRVGDDAAPDDDAAREAGRGGVGQLKAMRRSGAHDSN